MECVNWLFGVLFMLSPTPVETALYLMVRFLQEQPPKVSLI